MPRITQSPTGSFTLPLLALLLAAAVCAQTPTAPSSPVQAASAWTTAHRDGLIRVARTRTITVPIANYDDNQHAANENLRLQNLWDGVETMAALLSMN